VTRGYRIRANWPGGYYIYLWQADSQGTAVAEVWDHARAEGLSVTSVVPLPTYNDTTEDDDGRTDTD